MSFTSDVKKQLCKNRPSDRHAEAEVLGMLMLCRSFSFNKILFQTSSSDAAQYLCALFRKCFDIIPDIKKGGTSRPTFSVSVASEADRKKVLYRFGYKSGEDIILKTEELKTDGSVGAFVRGAFLAGGSMSDPEKEYRLDFSFMTRENAEAFTELLGSRGIMAKLTERAGKSIVYIKDSTMIEDALTLMGAGNETLNLINVKIYKDMKNKINRKNNCETRNILKSADAAFEQTRAIKKLKRRGKLESLPEELLEAAALRLANPEASLSELCRISGNKITRSGLSHRLGRLTELAKEVK